ncbi:hypothetical protein B0A67_24350 [Flavobacterium aquidurense]|nr:hypothetical protein B0A67_24350 [Flavobacterium aquidurense]
MRAVCQAERSPSPRSNWYAFNSAQDDKNATTKMRQQKCDNKNVTTKKGVKKLNLASLHAYFTPTIKELSELCG